MEILKRLKEELKQVYKKISMILLNSSFVFFIKEKYDHLSFLQQKIVKVVSAVLFVSLIFYYPVTKIALSQKNMKEFNTKKQLSRDLLKVSLEQSTGQNFSESIIADPVQFVKTRLLSLGITSNQVKSVTPLENLIVKKDLPDSITSKAILTQLVRLNLREVVEYAGKLEDLSDNVKLINIKITETKEQDNYFDVSYEMAFFKIDPKQVLPANGGILNKLKLKSSESKTNVVEEVKDPHSFQKTLVPEKKADQFLNISDQPSHGSSLLEKKRLKKRNNRVRPTPPPSSLAVPSPPPVEREAQPNYIKGQEQAPVSPVEKEDRSPLPPNPKDPLESPFLQEKSDPEKESNELEPLDSKIKDDFKSFSKEIKKRDLLPEFDLPPSFDKATNPYHRPIEK